MREIKFRGKVLEDGYNFRAGEFAYGSLVFEGDEPYMVGPVVEANEDYIAHEWWVPVDPATVGQYTGLKDKNGREIYEGDIIFRPNEVGRIEFSEDGSFLIRFPHHLARLNATWEPIEVIGNIHDNPELLEVKS